MKKLLALVLAGVMALSLLLAAAVKKVAPQTKAQIF